MSTSNAPQQDRSIRTQQALIDAFVKLLQKQSFDEITVAQIAAEAGLTTGAIYRRFKDKRALLEVAFERFYEDALEHQQTRVEATKDKSGLDLVEFMVRTTIEFGTPYLPLMRAASALNDQKSFAYMRDARNLTADWWCTQVKSSSLSEDELKHRIRFAMRTITAVFRDTLMAGPGAETETPASHKRTVDQMVKELTIMIGTYLES